MSIKWRGVLGTSKTIRGQAGASGSNIEGDDWTEPTVILTHESGASFQKEATLSGGGVFEVVVEPEELTLFGLYDVTFTAVDPDERLRAFPEGEPDQLYMREA
jgi:hypothetical protein